MIQPDGRGRAERATPARPGRSLNGLPAGRGRDRGSATAEFALLIPVLVVLLAAVLAAGAAGVAQLRCIDAARAGARLAARNEDPRRLTLAAAPSGASVLVSGRGDLVTVTVTARVVLPLPWRPRIGVGASSTAQVEPEAG